MDEGARQFGSQIPRCMYVHMQIYVYVYIGI